ncbi:MAG: hypothetical protein M3Z33_11790 [Actinomycetota bacterium]|nr:hypothetical protein [Actinomycetota bacterium]
MDRGVAPATALGKTGRVKAGEHEPPTCSHGEWTFAGALLAPRYQVALPEGRVRSRVAVGQSQGQMIGL